MKIIPEQNQDITQCSGINLLTFSFLAKNGSHGLAMPSQVSKNWYKFANKHELWLQAIKPQYRDDCKQEGSAKELYKKNIDARIDTYYVVGSLLHISTFPTATHRAQESNRTRGKILETFPKVDTLKAFDSKDSAIACADFFSQTVYNEYYYPPIFTVRIDHTPSITPTSIICQKTDFLENLSCYEVLFSQIKAIYSFFYKTGYKQLYDDIIEDFQISKEERGNIINLLNATAQAENCLIM